MLNFPIDLLILIVREVEHNLTFMSRGDDQHVHLMNVCAADACLGRFQLHCLLTHLVSVLTTNDCKLLVKSAATAYVLNRVHQKVG